MKRALTILSLFAAFLADASTVNFHFQDGQSNAIAGAACIITPVKGPFQGGHGYLTVNQNFKLTTDGTGSFTIPAMQHGLWSVHLQGGTQGDTWCQILVPNDGLTYNASDLVTNLSTLPESIGDFITANNAAITAATPFGTNQASGYPVYFGTLVPDTFTPPGNTSSNQEMTGAYCDGLHKFYAFNDPTNGCRFVVVNMDDSLVVSNTGQVALNAVQRTGFNVACGMVSDPVSGHLKVFISDWTNGTSWASSNAVCDFETNGRMDSLKLLGQQPYTVQHAAFLPNGTAAVCMFENPPTNWLGGTNLLIYNTNTWLPTGGLIPFPPVGVGPNEGFLSVNLSPVDNATLYLFCDGPRSSPPGVADRNRQYIYQLDPAGNLSLTAILRPTDRAFNMTEGSMAFYPRSNLVAYVVENFGGPPSPQIDTNQVVGFNLAATNPPLAITASTSIINPIFPTNAILQANQIVVGGGQYGTGTSSFFQLPGGDFETHIGFGNYWELTDGETNFFHIAPENGGEMQMFGNNGPISKGFNPTHIHLYSALLLGNVETNTGFTNVNSGNGFNGFGYYGNAGPMTNYNPTNIAKGNATTGQLMVFTNGYWTNLSVPSSGGGGSGTVTSVTFTGDGTVLSSTPSGPVTTSGTLTATLAAGFPANITNKLAGTNQPGLQSPTFTGNVTNNNATNWGARTQASAARDTNYGYVEFDGTVGGSAVWPAANLPTASAGVLGVSQPDNVTILAGSGATLSVAGSALTGLPGSAIATGIVAAARLPSASGIAAGIVQPDNVTLTIGSGLLSVAISGLSGIPSSALGDKPFIPPTNGTSTNLMLTNASLTGSTLNGFAFLYLTNMLYQAAQTPTVSTNFVGGGVSGGGAISITGNNMDFAIVLTQGTSTPTASAGLPLYSVTYGGAGWPSNPRAITTANAAPFASTARLAVQMIETVSNTATGFTVVYSHTGSTALGAGATETNYFHIGQ